MRSATAAPNGQAFSTTRLDVFAFKLKQKLIQNALVFVEVHAQTNISLNAQPTPPSRPRPLYTAASCVRRAPRLTETRNKSAVMSLMMHKSILIYISTYLSL